MVHYYAKHSSGFRLDYTLISNTFQKFVTMTEIMTSMLTDHSPVSFSLSEEKGYLTGKRFWKFNSSLIKDQN